MRLLLGHVGRLGGFAALFQPAAEQLPELLPQLVAAAAAGHDQGTTARQQEETGASQDLLKGAAALLQQFPWDATAGALSDEEITQGVAPQLVAFASLVGRAAVAPGAEADADEAAELAVVPVQVMLGLLRQEQQGPLLRAVWQ
jgi:hypothetical protein